MVNNLVNVKFVPKERVTEDFNDVKSISHKNYCEILGNVFRNGQITLNDLKFDFGTHGVEFEDITEDYFEPENRIKLFAIIMDCYSPVCSVYSIADNKAIKISSKLLVRDIEQGNVLCVHEDRRSIFIRK